MGSDLVVGAGFSGATIARLLAESGRHVVVIDRRPHIAGNSFDYRDDNGIMVHKYGSHIFHTSNAKVWKFIRRFTKFNTYMHKVIGVLDGIETCIPFNLNTLHDVFPRSLADRLEAKLLSAFKYGSKVPILEFMKQDDPDLRFLADFVYEKVFLHYTMKQWGLSPDDVDGAVTARVPVYISRDNRYFQDVYQGIPLDGYAKTVERILDHHSIDVRLNIDSKHVNMKDFDRVFFTGSIDELMDYRFGTLPYRSVRFEMETHDSEHYLPNAVVNYPCNYDFTRVHEYKYYLNDSSEKTVIAKEYSEEFELGRNERYYPIPGDESSELYGKYLNAVKEEYDNVYFLGRLGDYRYYDMDKAIARAIEVFESLPSV